MFCSIKFWLYDSNFMAIRGPFFPRPSRTPTRVGWTRAAGPIPDIPSTREHSKCLLRTEFNRLVFLKWQTIAKYGRGNEVREARETTAGMKGTRLLKEAK